MSKSEYSLLIDSEVKIGGTTHDEDDGGVMDGVMM